MRLKKSFLFILSVCMLVLLTFMPVHADIVDVDSAKTGWVKVGTTYKWMQEDGTYYKKAGWATLGGKVYYLNKNGGMKTGWIEVDGAKYFLDKSADLSKRGQRVTGKKLISGNYYFFSPKAAKAGQLTVGVVKIDNKYYYFDKANNGAMLKNQWKSSFYYGKNGARLTGLQTINNKVYYLGGTNGKKITNKLGIKVGKNYYRINGSGVCTRVSEVMGLAGIQLEKLGMGTNQEKNLKKAFDWSTSVRYMAMQGPADGKNIPEYYAIYGFKTKPGWGDCNVNSATFYYMAKVLGYTDMQFIQGRVPQANGVMGDHAWCERKVGTKYYFFDPNAAAAGKVGFNFLYGTSGSYRYMDSHNHVVQATN